MPRSATRVVTRVVPTPVPARSPAWIVAGFALGATAGWLIGELTGRVTRERLRDTLGDLRVRRHAAGAPVDTRQRVRAALDADPDLRSLDLQIVPAGRGAVELRGWVPSRTLRARATRIAATAASATRLIDALLVRGEDDRPLEDEPRPADAPQSA